MVSNFVCYNHHSLRHPSLLCSSMKGCRVNITSCLRVPGIIFQCNAQYANNFCPKADNKGSLFPCLPYMMDKFATFWSTKVLSNSILLTSVDIKCLWFMHDVSCSLEQGSLTLAIICRHNIASARLTKTMTNN